MKISWESLSYEISNAMKVLYEITMKCMSVGTSQ